MWIFDWVRVLEPKIDGKRIPVESNQKERGISLSTVVESQSFREKPHLLIGLKKKESATLHSGFCLPVHCFTCGRP
jgi:hypothetical protein